jgi:Gpi18-like mannosyltransferase
MKVNLSLRNIVLIWLGWALVMLSFQHWIGARLDLVRPDHALFWTPAETTAGSQDGKPYLNDSFLNEHVAWDSEFYLSVATLGYDDPAVRGVPADFKWGFRQQPCTPGLDEDCTALSYAFFPVYPWLTRLLAFPLRLIQMTPIARATLAAVSISLLGALGAMLALYSMTRGSLGEEGGVRAAFYLLIFPSGFFLAQVYTEGLFIGLTFGALAFLQARKWGWTALLAVLAAWTRPGGALLLLPMIMVWVNDKAWQGDWKSVLGRGLAAFSPALSYGLWSLTPLAERFFLVEKLYFSRRLLAIDQSLAAWKQALMAFTMDNPQAKFYYALEYAAVLFGFIACILLFKRSPEISIFGLAMIVFAFTSGAAQGMVRYVLAAPPLFWVLADWGRRPAFDRVWSLASILLMGMQAMLFSFDFWVA